MGDLVVVRVEEVVLTDSPTALRLRVLVGRIAVEVVDKTSPDVGLRISWAAWDAVLDDPGHPAPSVDNQLLHDARLRHQDPAQPHRTRRDRPTIACQPHPTHLQALDP